MKQQNLTFFLVLITFHTLNAQNSNKDVVNFRDNFDTKSLYQLRSNFDGKHKNTLIDFYSHYINCEIAEDIIISNNLTDISKENLVELIDENINGWDKDLLLSNTNELDSISVALNKFDYDQFGKEVKLINYSPYMFYEFSKLDEGTYLFLVNMSSLGASNNYTILTNKLFPTNDKYLSIDLDDFLVKESGLLTKKLNGIYSSSFSRNGASLTEINGKNYYVIYFSEQSDAGCCPSIIVAIPSFLNENYYELDTYYAKKENKEENKQIKWEKLN
jgi:hypothetical protein